MTKKPKFDSRVVCIDNKHLQRHVIKATSFLCKRHRKLLMEKAIFVSIGKEKGFMMHPHGRKVICLNEKILKAKKAQIYFVILHEIAHFLFAIEEDNANEFAFSLLEKKGWKFKQRADNKEPEVYTCQP